MSCSVLTGRYVLWCLQAFELTLDIDRLIKEVDYDRWAQDAGVAVAEQGNPHLHCVAHQVDWFAFALPTPSWLPTTTGCCDYCTSCNGRLCAGWSAVLCRSGFLDYKEFKTIMT